LVIVVDVISPLICCAHRADSPRFQRTNTNGQVSLADFELMTVLGRGGFGKVMQVRHKATGKVYAMKIFKKNELRKRRQVRISCLIRTSTPTYTTSSSSSW